MRIRRLEGLEQRRILRVLEVSLFLIVLAIASPLPLVTNAQPAPQSGSQACADQITSQEHTMLANVNSAQAEELAEQSPQFQSSVAGHSYEFTTVSADFSLNAATCSVARIGELSVGFNVTGVSFKYGSYTVPEGVQVWENPSMTQVLGTNVSTTTGGTYLNWSGYEVYYPVSGYNDPLYYAQIEDYYQPSISSNAVCTAAQTQCSLLIWNSLSQGQDGSGFLLQTGTAADIYCPNGTCGTASYSAFWEMVSSYPYYTCSTSTYKVSVGDEITPEEEYGLDWSGGANNQWETYIIDWTANGGSGWSCASGVLTYDSTAYYSGTILERPEISGALVPLAVFNSVATDGTEICISTTTCYFDGTPYGNGDYVKDSMVNSCSNTPNITLGNMGSTGDFTSTYYSNCGT
jgi:hypothetical protein